MKRLALVLAFSGALAACSHGGPGRPHEHFIFPGVTPASDEQSIAMANATCRVEDLNAERRGLMDQAYGLREMIAAEGYGIDTTLQTQVVELVNAFETDLDGAYTSVLTTCRSHAVCMHQNGYSEAYCDATRQEWRASRDQFAYLSENLADIRLAIAEQCIDCGVNPSGPVFIPRPGPPPPPPARSPSVGSVFSAPRPGGN